MCSIVYECDQLKIRKDTKSLISVNNDQYIYMYINEFDCTRYRISQQTHVTIRIDLFASISVVIKSKTH